MVQDSTLVRTGMNPRRVGQVDHAHNVIISASTLPFIERYENYRFLVMDAMGSIERQFHKVLLYRYDPERRRKAASDYSVTRGRSDSWVAPITLLQCFAP